MANKKVSQLSSKPSVLVTDLFPIADPSTGQLYKTTISDLGTAIGSGVSSVNGLVGAVVLDTDDIQELVSPTNKWFTDTRARAAISAGTGISYNSGTGVITNAVTSGQIATALGYTPANDSLVVKLAGTQTITGAKAFSAGTSFEGGIKLKENFAYLEAGYVGIAGVTGGIRVGVNPSYYSDLIFSASSSHSYTFPSATGTIALTSNLSAYALDSAVVHNTGNETIAGQKTFSSTLYGASAVFSSAVNVQSINVTGITASPSVYITTNGTNHAVSIVQSGAGYAIYASGNVAVIGTGYFSSSLTAASLSSTAGYNFTLPSASGTLALTSNLSSYLPLSGGTLTGALSGTSATFSGNVGIGSTLSAWISSTKVLQLNNTLALYAPSSEAILGNNVFVDSGDNNKYITTNFASQYRQVDGKHLFYSAASGTAGNTITFGSPKLEIASTGAATFSSSVTATSLFVNAGTGSNLRVISGGTNILNVANYSVADGFREFLLAGSELSFYSGTAGGGSLSERMRITPSGNVGIGTTSPANYTNYITQTINGANGAIVQLQSSGTPSLRLIGEGVDSYLDNVSTGALIFRTTSSSSERMRITSSGNVGIGTTAPSQKLDVNGSIKCDGSFISSSQVNSGSFTLDTSATTISLGSLGAVNIGSFSGMVLVTNTGNGVTMLFLCGGGFSSLVSQSTAGAAGTMTNFAGSGYTFTTAYTSTTNYSFQLFRTRIIA
jgi:hypothetical protein